MVMTLSDWIEREHVAFNKVADNAFIADIYSDWDKWEWEEYMKEQKQKCKEKYDKAVFMKEEGEKELTEARKEIKKYLLDILENY